MHVSVSMCFALVLALATLIFSTLPFFTIGEPNLFTFAIVHT